jgi:hypothetical protein
MSTAKQWLSVANVKILRGCRLTSDDVRLYTESDGLFLAVRTDLWIEGGGHCL